MMPKVFAGFGFASAAVFSYGAFVGAGIEMAAMATITMLLSSLLWTAGDLLNAVGDDS